MQDPIIKISGLNKIYGKGDEAVNALGPVDISIKKGSFTVILGRSGSGKSTLLNLMAGLDRPTSGVLEVQGKNLVNLNSRQLAAYRSKIGIIFQFYNLLSNLNTLENVLMGSWTGGRKANPEDAKKLLEKFNISHRANSNVKNLSGGEKQRVAIARSLVDQPEILFCDEPTGALDTNNENQVEQILKELNQEGLTIVMVTHNPDFSNMADQVIYMKDGLVERVEEKRKQRENPLENFKKQL